MDPEHIRIIATLFVVFASAIGGGLIARKLGLPLLLGYIFLGIVAGNMLSHIIDVSFVTLVGEVGVVLLLFTLGIEFSFLRLRTILKIVAVPAAIQVAFSIALFTAVYVYFGFSIPVALFFAAAGSLSSTAIVMKILTEKGKLGTNIAHILTGWLVVQDLAVLPLMILLPIVTTEAGEADWIVGALAQGILRSMMTLAAVVVLGRHFIPKILDRVSRVQSREIFLLSTVAIVFFFGSFQRCGRFVSCSGCVYLWSCYCGDKSAS